AVEAGVELDDVGPLEAEGAVDREARPLRRDKSDLPLPVLVVHPAADPDRALVDGEDLFHREADGPAGLDRAGGKALAQDLSNLVERGAELEGAVLLEQLRGGEAVNDLRPPLGIEPGELVAEQCL